MHSQYCTIRLRHLQRMRDLAIVDSIFNMSISRSEIYSKFIRICSRPYYIILWNQHTDSKTIAYQHHIELIICDKDLSGHANFLFLLSFYHRRNQIVTKAILTLKQFYRIIITLCQFLPISINQIDTLRLVNTISIDNMIRRI